MKQTRFYRLKHIPTGLYYSRGALSEKGKIYTSANNFKTYLGHYQDTLHVAWGCRLHKKYKDILEPLDACQKPVMVGDNRDIRISPIEIPVYATDFEIEYIDQ
jgi:hypothetical protein